MVRPITIQDNGGDRYTITTTITTLGRRYDNNAENIVVNFPQAEIEAGHICTMIVTAFGKVVDHIEVENGVELPITSNLSQYSEVKIGFSFTDDENYVKNSETHTFKFLEAQRPDGFVPVPPEQSGNIDMLIRKGFVDVSKSGSYIIFYNLAHEEVARIRVEGGGGGGGCVIYVNGEEVEELSFDSDPQTQIDTINTAIELVQGQLSEKATIEYVDERFNGANKALSYGDYETMITAFNALDDDVYSVGQNVYIVTREVPDLWISSVEETSVPYVYVDDATFVSALSTDGYVQVGYYKFSALETQKVDLTDYATQDWVKGNTFPVISPPASATPLTAEEVETFIKGCVVNGTFLGTQNPMFLPCMYNSSSNEYFGVVIYSEYRTPGSVRTYFRQYKIGNGQSYHYRWLELGQTCFAYDGYGTGNILFTKVFPAYPTDLTKDYVLQQDKTSGTLSWVELPSGDNNAIIHEFQEGDTLTQTILDEVKSGDIVKVNNMEFVVNNKTNQTPRSITGTMLIGNNQYIKLDWEIGQTLTPSIQQVLPMWYGTQAQYDALETYDSNTIYNILES